jgi:hypothetical protein
MNLFRERRTTDAAAEASGFTSVRARRVTFQSAGLVKTCPGLRLSAHQERRVEVLADGGPPNNTANNMRVQVCPFLPAVHEAEGRRPRDRATPGRVLRRLRSVSRIGDLEAVASA